MNTIDLLDECLTISYQMRKSSIKARKHKPKGGDSSTGEKNTFKMGEKVVVKGRYIAPKHYGEIVDSVSNKRYRVRWVFNDYEEEIEILESHKLKTWQIGKKDFFVDEDEVSPMMNSNSISSPGGEKPGMRKQSSFTGKKTTVEFATVESQKDDQFAEKTFDAFKNELNEWWIDNASQRDDEDLRGQVADDFTEVNNIATPITLFHSTLSFSSTINSLFMHSYVHSSLYSIRQLLCVVLCYECCTYYF